MQNFVKTGEQLVLTAPYARSSGEGALVGNIFGVAVSDVENGAEGLFELEGVYDLAKTTSQAWTQGDPIYWNTSTKKADSSAGTGPFIGYATQDAGSSDAIGRVKLGGNDDEVVIPQAAIVTLTDSTGLSGTHNDTLSATTVPADLTGGESPTEAEHNALLAVVRVMAQNSSDQAQKLIEVLAALVAAGVIAA